ncbi:efflux RND transporter periplasmic adaptor subunit [Marinomonas rhizomae]|uniref:RND family efflux transporter MFP subunit n=1 Tax=Marinomonas rhizomae TaxID=491948 RepID=A0A366JAH8_9GAMM|nr:efflux RND transporter periplasmic adaptor subunit [Marinomonas rhizomae]RBP83867.1 RND family efflux transporter MFP subunit [Marinomonas rhizomae]RNF73427.1 efflux RND transporter periplasmic adaptor subunit [Marinomonas rhizomae]
MSVYCRTRSRVTLVLGMMLSGVLNANTLLKDNEPRGAKWVSQPTIRVQLNAKDRAVLSSQLSGRIKTLTLKEGQSFKKGQTLVEFDCDIYKAKLDYAKAAAQAAEQKRAVAKRLDNLQSISVMEVNQAESDALMAQAERRIGEIMVSRCGVYAPFHGRVVKRLVQQGEFVSEGESILEVYNSKVFEVALIVPSRWISDIKIGHAFQVKLDETQQMYNAKVTRLGAVIDPLSQSFTVFGEILKTPNVRLIPGMSGNAYFDPSQWTSTTESVR